MPSRLSLIKKVHRKRDARRTTMMLIIVITVFLMTEIPLMVITVLHTLSNRFKMSFSRNISSSSCSFNLFLDYEVASNIIHIINTFMCFTYPLNFAIYCGMSR